MADKLIFPIGFDLEAGLKAAEGDFNRVARQLENAVKKNPVKVPIGFDETTAKRLREEAKDIERVLANIKNHYGSGQLKGLSIGFVNTQKEIDGIKRLEAQLQALRQQRTSLVNAGATIEELNRVDAAIRGTESRLKMLTQAFNKDMSSNVAITQQIIKLKQLSEELAGIDRMYARLQASASAANRPVNSFEANEMLVRRREIMEEIARVTRTATEAQKELFNIKGVGTGASQGIFGIGGEQGLSAITEQISRYETLKKQLQEVEGQYERLKAMQAQGMGDQSEKINQTLRQRIAIQKELGEITQTAAQAQKELEKKAQATAAAFQRGRGAIENFNRVMKLPENRITNIQQKINLLNQALKRVGIGSTEFNKIVAELTRLGRKIDEAKAKQEALTGAQKKTGEAGSRAFREQSSYLNILIKRLAVYTSVDAVMGFLTKVREVTAQFELQRISLGAIINDQVRANMLFNEIKQFALKSPIKILDLTKYTKQLAAFRFETDTLFDTTKRVADISVGLSVPMDRLILALGHVKASTYLTGITLRQFSMAGIPMLELLAERFTELEGRAVSTTDVLKRVHDKMVSFEDVNQVFINLTSAGGMFYNMQEKQGDTLYGLWAKLGDAASVMYDQIGNTESVNKGMKSAIDTLTVMMRNWRDVARIATEAGIAFAVYRLAVIASTKATALATVWEKKDIVLRQMHLKTVMAQSMHVRNFNRVLLASGVSAQKASTATWVFSRALHGLKAAIATTGIGALIIGLALLVDKLLFSKSAAEQLKESLDNIETESVQEQDKSVRNFERLAKIAVSASSTYKEQQAALDELKRTYKEIIPQEQLTIENLKQMNGNYELLTASIRKYVAERMKQKQTDEIINTYAYEILKIQRKVNNELKNKYSYEQLAAFWEKYTEIVKDASKSAGKSVSELINMTVSAMGADLQFAHDLGSVWTLFAHDHADISRMTTLVREQERQIDALSKTYDSAAMAMGEYAKSYNEAVDNITENGVKLNGAVIEQEDNPLLYFQQKANLEVKDAMIPTIKEAFNAAGIAFNDGWTSLIENVDENMPQLTSSINFDSMVEKVNEESQKLLAELQTRLDALDARREAYLKQIKAEEAKGKGGNDEVIESAKASYNEIGNEIEKLEERARKINILLQLLEHLKKKYEDLAPSDSVVKLMRQRFDSIVDYTKDYAKNMRRFRMNADEDMEAYRKRLSDEVELIKKNIKAWTAAMVLARLFRNKTEEQNLQNLIDEAKLQLADLEKILGDMPEFEKGRGSGRTSDPRLQNLKEEISLVQKLYNEYKQLEKQEGASKAAADMRKMAGGTLDMFKEKYNIDLPTDAKDLTAALEILYTKMAQLPKKVFPALDKDLKELRWTIEKVNIDESQKKIESELKALADRISRTKTAREFYEKILRLTRNEDLAFQATFSVYGKDRLDTFADEVEQLKQNFGEIDITTNINLNTRQIDYKKLREIWDADKALPDNLRKVPSAYDSAIKSILDAGDKASERQFERWGNDLERARQYADKRIELAEYTATQIAEIEAKRDSLDPESKNYAAQVAMYNKMISGYREREKNEAAKLDYEQIKEQIGMFDDLGVRIGTAFENILTQLREYTQSPDFARLGLEAQKNVYQQIAKIEDRMAEGFQGIGVGTVSEYVRQYSTAASEYLTAQNNLRDATLRAIEADKEWERVKNSNDEAAKTAALAEKQLADSRVRTAAASENTAGANLQATQERAARASAKFDNNLQKVEQSIRGLNNGALKALWDLLGDKGKRSVGEFLSGSYKMVSAINKLTDAVAKSGSDMGALSKTIAENLANALQSIDPEDTEAIAKAATESLKTTLSSVISDKGVVDLLANTLSKNIGEIASQALSGVLSTEDAANKVGALIDGVADAASKTGEMWGAIISLVLSLLDEFAENGIGTFLGELLDNIADAVEGILANLLTDSLPKIIGSVGNVIKGVGTGLGDLLTFGAFDLTGAKRIKKANKEIERQQELLDQLEYTYGRLEKAADKLFGADFVANQKQQQKILLAQQQAYMKQYEAEMSKGKKADKEKAQEFLDKARDVGDQIADMQGKIAERMLGTDLTSAARDFANAWLEAYKEFGNTADAMSEKFHEMIQNMIVESLLAKVMERALKPAFDMIDNMNEEDFYSESFWKKVIATAEQGAKDADHGAGVVMKWIEKMGYDMREMGSEYSGIAKDVAGATSEEINANTAALNTQNYYMATLSANVALIRQLMERGTTSTLPDTTAAGWTDWQQQAMDNYIAIQRNTADTVVECRRAANACEASVEKLGRIITSKGSVSGVNVFMKG